MMTLQTFALYIATAPGSVARLIPPTFLPKEADYCSSFDVNDAYVQSWMTIEKRQHEKTYANISDIRLDL